MTLADLLQHWSITENPFRDEEARSDSVFARMLLQEARTTARATSHAHTPSTSGSPASAPSNGSSSPAAAPSNGSPSAVSSGSIRPAYHSDFEKLVGNPRHPATSIVFGEKGSGKTAIRLQIADHIRLHNIHHPAERVLLISCEDLNPFLDRLHAVVGTSVKGQAKTPLESFQTIRLVDHIDWILHLATPRIVDAVLSNGTAPDCLDVAPESRRSLAGRARRFPEAARRDLLLLQVAYDRPGEADERTASLRSALGFWPEIIPMLWRAAAWFGWAPALAAWLGEAWIEGKAGVELPNPYLAIVLAVAWLAVLLKVEVVDRILLDTLGRRLRRQVRCIQRGHESFARGVRGLPRRFRDQTALPVTDSDAPRYEMLARLRRAIAGFGYTGVIVVYDRVDEPTLVNGDADRMRAVVWPLLNNKFLQQEGFGVKLLLPIELRYLLMKESSAFFQQARMDKQGMVEHLAWSGAMLYDMCEARLRACRSPLAEPMSLLDLFSEDVTRQDVVDALDQMRQPRDAFKFLYRCMTEHAAGVTREQNSWRISRQILDIVRRQEAERLQQFARGIRPA